MNGRSFLDTNVFVYLLDQSAPEKSKIAHDLIRTHLAKRSGVVSFQVVQEFLNVALKKFSSAMTLEQSTRFLFNVMDPLLAVQSSTALYSTALSIYRRHKLSWYDAIIIAAASEANCRILYSEDMQHGAVIDGVRIENPFPRPS